MVLAAAEYETQVGLTEAFINTDPESVVFSRRERVRDPETGALVWQDGVPHGPYTVRIQEYQTNAAPMNQVETAGGEVVMPDLYLLGMPDADIQEDDTFSWRGESWRVDSIHPKPDYETRADVVRDVF